MSHPTHEELTEFLYDELAPERQTDVASHVASCDACRATVESWRGVRTQLVAWKLPAPSVITGASPGARTAGAIRWAVAACVLLGTGYVVARVTQRTAVDEAALRAQLVREISHEVKEEVAAELSTHAANQAKWQEQLQDNLVDVISQLETRQVANTVSLRKDVETVAVYAQEGINRLAIATQGGPIPGKGGGTNGAAPREQ